MMVKTCADTQAISSFTNDLTDFWYLAEKRNVREVSLGMMNATMYCRPSKKSSFS